jgi:hypothetical protein
MRLIEFRAIMLTAFALVPSEAHRAELPNKVPTGAGNRSADRPSMGSLG